MPFNMTANQHKGDNMNLRNNTVCTVLSKPIVGDTHQTVYKKESASKDEMKDEAKKRVDLCTE